MCIPITASSDKRAWPAKGVAVGPAFCYAVEELFGYVG